MLDAETERVKGGRPNCKRKPEVRKRQLSVATEQVLHALPMVAQFGVVVVFIEFEINDLVDSVTNYGVKKNALYFPAPVEIVVVAFSEGPQKRQKARCVPGVGDFVTSNHVRRNGQ